MALLIATELLTLLFAMNTLSAVRSLVHGEGMWSKAQKDAIQNLQQFVITRDKEYLNQFHEDIRVNMGDRQARLELAKPNMDFDVVKQGFVQGKIHADDVPAIVTMLRRFSSVSYLQNAIYQWQEADKLIEEMIAVSKEIDHSIQKGDLSKNELHTFLSRITNLNGRLTYRENEFSSTLGAASRWLERLLAILLVCAVITIEGLGLALTISFTTGLSRTLKELSQFAERVGHGNFDYHVAVHSRDELGVLAESLNIMADNLQNESTNR